MQDDKLLGRLLLLFIYGRQDGGQDEKRHAGLFYYLFSVGRMVGRMINY